MFFFKTADLFASACTLDRRIDRDAHQPGRESRAPLEVSDVLEGLHKNVLHSVFGFISTAENSNEASINPASVFSN